MDKLPDGLGHMNCTFGDRYRTGDKGNHYFRCLEAKINELVERINELEARLPKKRTRTAKPYTPKRPK